ncbi:hypothetical protein Tco_0464513 [Tanacetum coccineum]
MLDEDAVRLCLLIASELMFMGKEKRNFLTKHIMWLVDDFEAWNLSNPNVALISSPEEMKQAWFMASVEFIKGLADQDGKFIQDDEARVNCIEHNNGMCGDTEVGKFLQDKEARVNGIEHHNGMCGDTEDGNFVEGIDETICPKSNQMSVEEGDGVLDSEGDGVHLSQTNDVIQQAVNLSTMSSTIPQAISPAVAEFFSEFDALKKGSEDMPNFCSNHNDTSNHIGGLSTEAKPLSSSSNLGNEKDVSHLDDLIEIDGENVKDGYNDDCILRTRKPNDAYDVFEVDNYEDDYMFMLNNEEKPGIFEQQPNASKEKTIVFEEIVGVKVEEKPGLGRGKFFAMALKPPFGQQSATTPVPKKRKSRIMKQEVIVSPFDLEDISGQPRIWSINDIMTHEHFVENLSRPDDCKSDKVTVPEHMCRSFLLSLSCLNTGKVVWLNDHERISKKRTKNKAKTTKPDTEWKSVEKTQSNPSSSVKKSQQQVNPDKPEAKKSRKTSLGTKLVKSLILFKEEKEEKKEKGPFCQFGKVKPQGAKLPKDKSYNTQGLVVQLVI